jgi:excisionase family DNA binding protein
LTVAQKKQRAGQGARDNKQVGNDSITNVPNLSIAHAARVLGHSRGAILEMIHSGKLSAWRDCRGRIWVSRASIQSFKKARLESLERRLAEKRQQAQVVGEVAK